MRYKSVENQSFFDLALMFYNDPTRAWEISKMNSISFLNVVLPNTEIVYESNIQIEENGYNNVSNSIISTSRNNILLVNSFSDSFDLNSFF